MRSVSCLLKTREQSSVNSMREQLCASCLPLKLSSQVAHLRKHPKAVSVATLGTQKSAQRHCHACAGDLSKLSAGMLSGVLWGQ